LAERCGKKSMEIESQVADTGSGELDRLLEKVYQKAGFDFRSYRRSMLVRRLERRLRSLGLENIPAYMRYLDTHPEEYRKILEHLTIKVSGFFRCPYTFQRLTNLLLPELVSYKRGKGERGLKFWSTACARGEEPYSIGILLSEFLGKEKSDFETAIYGTDISRKVLSDAKEGIYFADDLEGLSGPLRERYFSQHGPGYLLRSDIRQMVTFGYYDLTTTAEPPVNNADCIFCCNVLIYWQRALQSEVLGRLYEVLATPGYLVLGEVETPTANVSGKLVCLDEKAKIYKKVS